MTGAQLARWIATCGGAGNLKPAPGTWGTLAGSIVAIAVQMIAGPPATLGLAALLLVAGTWAAGVYAREVGIADPSEVVIDEAGAMALVLALVPFQVWSVALSFALFRLFDIWKPWPVSLAEQRLKGAAGIMADDYVAGAMAVGGVWLADALLLP